MDIPIALIAFVWVILFLLEHFLYENQRKRAPITGSGP